MSKTKKFALFTDPRLCFRQWASIFAGNLRSSFDRVSHFATPNYVGHYTVPGLQAMKRLDGFFLPRAMISSVIGNIFEFPSFYDRLPSDKSSVLSLPANTVGVF